MSHSNFVPVQVHISPSASRSASDTVGEEEQKTSESNVLAQVNSMRLMILQIQQQMAALSQTTTRRSIADTLQPAHGEKAGEYSASAAIQRPPVVAPPAQQRATELRRQSIGVPSIPTSYLLTPTPAATSTPAPRRASTAAVRMESLSEDTEEAETDEYEADATAAAATEATASTTAAVTDTTEDGMPPYDARLERVRKSITHIVKPFHGQSDMDKYTVLDWCEKIDTEFSVMMGTRQDGRLGIVRSLLAGAALKWMNRKLLELNKKALQGELSEVIEWETMRKPFIDAHLGVNTIETFKSQLRALRLNSAKTPTPVELNQEFDHLAALAYPDSRSDMRDTVLGDEYGRIIAFSDIVMFQQVTCNHNPTEVEQWKLHVSRRWAALRQVEAVRAMVKGQAGSGQGGGGGWKGWQNKAQSPASATAAAMAEVDGAGMEGEPHTEEGQAAEQLSAFSGAPRRTRRTRRWQRRQRSRSRWRRQAHERREEEAVRGAALLPLQGGRATQWRAVRSHQCHSSREKSRPASSHGGTCMASRFSQLSDHHSSHLRSDGWTDGVCGRSGCAEEYDSGEWTAGRSGVCRHADRHWSLVLLHPSQLCREAGAAAVGTEWANHRDTGRPADDSGYARGASEADACVRRGGGLLAAGAGWTE